MNVNMKIRNTIFSEELDAYYLNFSSSLIPVRVNILIYIMTRTYKSIVGEHDNKIYLEAFILRIVLSRF